MLELKILSANVLLPVVILAGTLLGIRWSKRSDERKDHGSSNETLEPPSPRVREKLNATLLIVASVVAIWLAFGLRVGFSLWPEDAWARLPQSFAIAGIGSAAAIWLTGSAAATKAIAWAVRLGCVVVAAKIVIPTGEAWEFLQPTENTWWALLVLSPLVSWWFIDRAHARIAAAYGFGTIALVAAAAFLSSEFLRVTEPLLALASIVGCTSIATWRAQNALPISAVFGPCILGMGAAVASAQFNSFAGKPDSLSWLAISTPAIATILLMMVGDGGKAIRPSWKKLALILAICLSLAACVVGWTIVFGGTSSEDEWSLRMHQSAASLRKA